MAFDGKHLLIIVENLAVPFDRRVWQEATTLKKHGADVSVICPKMKGYEKAYEEIEGIEIFRHPMPVEGNGVLGFLIEYFVAIFWQWYYSWKIYFRKKFQVIQGCNPPDLVFLIAAPFKLLGVKYVFDHHDLSPELFIAKYSKKGFFYRILILAERCTFKLADYSIATNDSYKQIAITRGRMPINKIQVIRSGPDLGRLKISSGNLKYKKGRSYLIGYVGVIGKQEGLDLLLESIKYIVKIRQDIQFAIIGDGTELHNIKRLAMELKVSQFVDFYGRINDENLLEILNTADVCVNPDMPTVMNDLSTMNKIMEYMALKKSIVQYDLKEGRFSAMDASLYADNFNSKDFALKILYLIDNPDVRSKMERYGYNRVLNQLSWAFESQKLLSFYKTIFEMKQIEL